MAQKDVGNKIPIYILKTTDEVMKYYDEWGDKDKYNKDMVDWNYTGPKETVVTFNKHENNKDTLIFDRSSCRWPSSEHLRRAGCPGPGRPLRRRGFAPRVAATRKEENSESGIPMVSNNRA